jgi:CDP-diacylglycerol--serine O-phosphatidyltransferase
MTAIFIASLPLIESSTFNPIYSNTLSLCIISIVLSLLMISKINLFSIKLNFEKNILSQLNTIQLFMLISSLILLFTFHLGAIPFIVVLYVLLSIINNII